MKKVARKRSKKEVVGPAVSAVPQQRVLPLAEILVRAGEELRELVMSTGLQVFDAMLEEDREALCGPRSAPSRERRAYRHGYDRGRVVLGGRKVTISKPRVRDVEGREVALPSWEEMRGEDPLSSRMLNQMMVGVSTRKYERSLEELPLEMRSVAVKKSSVSRRFVARTSEQVAEFLSRPLDSLDVPVILLDGTQMGKSVIVVALGIDSTGRKHVLGVQEGSTESHGVCRSLLRNLVRRGLEADRPRLFVVDGGKGLLKAIRLSFGAWAAIQRCHFHKARNVVDHLPKDKQAWMRHQLRAVWKMVDATAARRKMEGLARSLEEEHPGAAASLREGIEEIFTLQELGIEGRLYRSLHTTNPIENLQGRLKDIARRVKRWRGGSMALRWGVSGLLEAEKKFRRINGYTDMPTLLAALRRRALEAGLLKESHIA